MRAASLLVLLLAGLATSPAYAATKSGMKMYRYKVDGVLVIRDSVPPEFAKLGYEVIGKNGMVIEVVPPAPTAEQIAERRRNEKAEAERAEHIKTLTEHDVNLLRLYERPEDVERARLRKSDEINSYIGLLAKRIDSFRTKLEPLNAQKVAAEEHQRPLPPGLAEEIAGIEKGIADGEKDIRDRRDELGRITRDYAEQYERVRILQLYPAGTLEEDVDFQKLDAELAKRQAAQSGNGNKPKP